jgi:16S rRNA (adenine1518-N6/adenine1519-N6)-dimethyltransferase
VAQSIARLLQAHGLSPRKGLGQSFLGDPAILSQIVSAADLSSEDLVVEIGAGTGSLTRALAENAGRIVALELDQRLVEVLHEQLADLPSVDIHHADALTFPRDGLRSRGYKVVGNLPYYITSAVLRRYLEEEPRPELMVVTVQREVAERVVAVPGDMSLLAVSVQFYGRPRIVTHIRAGAFYPPPKVNSSVLRIDVHEQPTVALAKGIDAKLFFRVVRAGFSQRRKTLRNSLRGGLGLSPLAVEEALQKAHVDSRRRAQTLNLQEWAALAEAFGTEKARGVV